MLANCRLRLVLLFLMVIISLCFPGCKGNGHSPLDVTSLPSVESSGGAVNSGLSGNRVLCSLWDCSIDAATGEVEAAPLREVNFHANLVTLMNTPGKIGFKPVSSNPGAGEFTFDITLHHPLPYQKFKGHDVRGIVFGPGELMGSKADPDLTWIKPGGFSLLNADGYTRWWNPKEFTTEGMYGYTSGIYGTSGFPPDVSKSAALNPYKYFSPAIGATDPVVPGILASMGEFAAGGTATRRYEMRFPIVYGNPEIKFQYAVDASWAPPAGANCDEAFYIKVDITKNTLSYYKEGVSGGELELRIEVFDWGAAANPNGIGGEILKVNLQSATLFDYEEIIKSPASPGTSQYSGIYTFADFTGSLHPDSINDQEILIRVVASGPLSYAPPFEGPVFPSGKNLNAYSIISVPVKDGSGDFIFNEVTPPGLNFAPIATCEDNGYLYAACEARGLLIFDNSDPSNPQWIKTVPTNYFSGLYKDAKDVDVSNGYAFVTESYNGIIIVDIDPPESAYVVNTIYPGELDIGKYFSCTTIDGNYVYSGCVEDKPYILITDVSNPSSPNIVNTLHPLDSDYEISSIKVNSGCLYAAINGDGLIIANVEDPESPSIINEFKCGYICDIDIQDNIAYLADAGNGIYIADISQPYSPFITGQPLYIDGGANHIKIKDGYAYATGPTTGMHVLNIDSVLAPYIVNTIPLSSYATCLDLSGSYSNVSSTNLNVIDIQIPESAFIAYSPGIPRARHVALAGSLGFASDNYYLYIISLADPENAYVVKRIDCPGITDIAAYGGYLFVGRVPALLQVDYGLRIYDVDPPESAELVKNLHFEADDTVDKVDVSYANGYVYLIDGTGYLRVIDVDPAEMAQDVNDLYDENGFKAITIPDGSAYAYLAGKNEAEIVDISQPESAAVVKTVSLNQISESLACNSEYLFSYGHKGSISNITIIDVSPVSSAQVVNVMGCFWAREICISGKYIFIALDSSYLGYAGVVAYDVEPPEAAHFVGGALTYDFPDDIAAWGDYVYVTDWSGGLCIFKLN